MSGPHPTRVIGVPRVWETLQQARSGDAFAAPYAVPFIQSVPTLVEMTNAALNVLDDDPDGFFLMVEGGAVDWAAHSNPIRPDDRGGSSSTTRSKPCCAGSR
jgi:alkaline phosphatase